MGEEGRVCRLPAHPLGAGTAGLVTAIGAAGLGAKVALIERDLMGDDCLNVGCVPSKACRIVGATIVARHAGEMLPELTLAVAHGIGPGKIARTIHPYPTQAEAIRRIGDAYNRTRLTPRLKRLFGTWLRWTR